MNVVGRVGNLITQGVYSVATPFHPFGGAVDVIVVMQHDGSFRSTPWYVRFGKFQGVLKGAEKVVRIAVNGVEADFHMYLDNSGEAYFVKEVDNNTNSEGGEDSENPEFVSVNGDLPPLNDNDLLGNVRRLKHSVSDSGVVRLQEHINDSMEEHGQRAESDSERGFYDFQDGQSSLDDSVDLSEFGSNRFNGLNGENVVESQNLDSEVVLVSVDGLILTAPITSAEQNSEDVQLSTPRFHLGPGEEAEFGDGDYDFGSGDNPWAVDYMSKLNGAADDNVSSGKTGDNALGHQLQVRGGEEIKHASRELDGREIEVEEDDIKEHIHSDDTVEVKNEDGCKSCLKSSREVKDLSSSSAVQISKDPRDITINGDKSTSACSSTSLNNDVPLDILCDNGPVKENGDFSDDTGLDKREGDSTCGLSENSELKEDQQFEVDTSALVVEADTHTVEDVEIGSTPERPPAVDEGSRNAPTESPTTTYDEISQTHSNTSFEISICANKLQPGMGLEAAAEAFNAHRVSMEEFKSSASSIVKNGNLVVRFKGQYFPWEKASHIALGIAAFGFDIPVETKGAIPVEHDTSKNGDPGLASTPSGRRWRLWSIPFRRVKTLEHNDSSLSNEDEYVDTESVLPNSQLESPTSESRTESPRKQLVRTNVASSEQIASLNLKDGQNVVTFSFSTRVLGQQQVEAHIYLWKWNARIVISDVDGTITKSDVLGQFMPLVGRDWSQSGVAKLFSAIKENGYQLLFLSARAIVQAYLTRSFLLNLTQDGNSLPNGPVVISPDGLFPSLYREVIRRAPHEFKIACLEDIKRLFPSDYNPFYAGFGNRDTDELSYRKMAIPKGKIFIINPKGEVAINRIGVKSYTSLHTLVDDMFPPTSLVEQEDYNSWNFWRVPLPEVEE